MTIEYRRDIRASYMLLVQDERLDGYEMDMMKQNQIPGLLSFGSRYEDMKTVYQYDITGKQALDIRLASRLADNELLVTLMTGICSVLEQIENYLLDPDKLLLLPECIFWDNETGEIAFCYYPGNTQVMTEMFQRLMEYLLPKIDHKDENAVTFAYAVYEETLREGYHLEGIRRQVMSIKRENAVNLEGNERKVIQQEEFRSESTTEKEAEEIKDKKSIIKKLMEMLENRHMLWGKILERCTPKVYKKAEKEECFVFEPEPEEIRQGRPTVLLAEVIQGPQGTLKYEGNHHLQDIEIDHFPFLIGSDGTCDAVLDQKAVSRLHARITQTEGVYFIEDLNSTNGTFVGGQSLSYKMRVSIEPNEMIMFANEKFRFI